MSDREERVPAETIAIVGMAGRFPGARSVSQFWENLKAGRESISLLSDEELLASGIDAKLLADPRYVKARGVLEDVDLIALERRQNRKLSESVVASKWRQEIFEPTVSAVPEELQGRLPAAEVFHQVLEHRWFLSERAGKDIGIDKAVKSYVRSELPMLPAERIVLEGPGAAEPDE